MGVLSKKTKGVCVSAQVKYKRTLSDPAKGYYFFSYTITIENNSDEKIQLLRRIWNIIDSNGEKRVVEGNGVVGEQPVLLPGANYTYESGCNFASEIGVMKGVYLMETLSNHKTFEVVIPEMHMITPGKLN